MLGIYLISMDFDCCSLVCINCNSLHKSSWNLYRLLLYSLLFLNVHWNCINSYWFCCFCCFVQSRTHFDSFLHAPIYVLWVASDFVDFLHIIIDSRGPGLVPCLVRGPGGPRREGQAPGASVGWKGKPHGPWRWWDARIGLRLPSSLVGKWGLIADPIAAAVQVMPLQTRPHKFCFKLMLLWIRDHFTWGHFGYLGGSARPFQNHFIYAKSILFMQKVCYLCFFHFVFGLSQAPNGES